MRIGRLLLGVGLLSLGCSPPPAAPQIPPRATSDLACADEIQVAEVAPNSFRARGCGREVTYTCVTNSYDRRFISWSCIREAPLSASR